MLFNSLGYLFFLPLVTLVYYMLGHKHRWWWLLLASYGFYMAWRPEYALLIFGSTMIDYWAARKMGEQPDKQKRKPWLYLSLLVNLGLLMSFKYLGFFNEAIHDFLGMFGAEYVAPRFDILLPIGISFYTFQTLSYTIDVYRGDREPEKHLGIFALYVSFFPQLVAGPIEKSTRFLPQFLRKVQFNFQRVVDGSKLILWGLFKKMVIADNLAVFVDYVYADPEAYGGNVLILAAFAFMFQVYCDFSAYSDIAIGSAQVLGFDLMDNFKRPFFATSLPEVWKRWHISLTDWINDYMYRPLRKRFPSTLGRYFAIYIIFGTLGFWHGAGWTFILFGLIHATYITVHHLTQKLRDKFTQKSGLAKVPRFKRVLDILITFNLWVFAGIFIRSNSVSDAWYTITHLFSGDGLLRYKYIMSEFTMTNFAAIVLGMLVLAIIEFTNKTDLRHPFHQIPWQPLRWLAFIGMIFAIILFKTRISEAFYYFQF
jgi:alginate O-acetyltransferase complex protein AlgI